MISHLLLCDDPDVKLEVEVIDLLQVDATQIGVAGALGL